MRIAVLANAASPHTRRWATAYAARGHEVHVISIRAAAIPGVTTHRIGVGPASSGRWWWSLLSYARLLAAARRLLRRIDPAVVHAHYSVTHGGIAVAAGRPVVVTVWGSDLLRGDRTVGPFGRRVNRFVLRRAAAVTASSRFLAGAAETVAGDGRPVRHVPFGVDTGVFAPVAEPGPGAFTVGFVKRFEPRYGADVLVDAFARVVAEEPDARLLLAGGGSRREAVAEQVRRLGLSQQVEFVGEIPHDAVPDLLGRCHVLANPSRSESFGVALLEAAACGLPVVATRVGGTAETVVDGVTGLLVPVGDADALAAALVGLAADPARRRAMGEAGRAKVIAEYEWEGCVDRMLQVLDEVAAP